MQHREESDLERSIETNQMKSTCDLEIEMPKDLQRSIEPKQSQQQSEQDVTESHEAHSDFMHMISAANRKEASKAPHSKRP